MSVESTATDPYEVVLADLRAKKAQIEQAISAIEILRGNAPAMPANPAPNSEKPPVNSLRRLREKLGPCAPIDGA